MGIYSSVHVYIMIKNKAFSMVATFNSAFYKCSMMPSVTHKGTQSALCINLHVPQEGKFSRFNKEGSL